MSNEMKWEIICRFPEWTQARFPEDPNFDKGPLKFGAYGARYLLTTGILADPDWPEEDERWLKYDPHKEVAKEFKRQYAEWTGKKFHGEILFINYSDLTVIPNQDKTNE